MGASSRRTPVESAARHGNLELLQFFKNHAISAEDDNGRGIRGDPGVFPLVPHFLRWGSRDSTAAVQGNQAEVVWWLYQNIRVRARHTNLNVVVSAAVKNQNMVLVEWIHSNFRFNATVAYDAMKEAVLGGRVDIMDWLFRHGYSSGPSKNGDRDVMDWLVKRKLVSVGGLIKETVDQSRLDMTKYLHSHYWQGPGVERKLYDSHTERQNAMLYAVSNGDIDSVQWLYESFANNPNTQLLNFIPMPDPDVPCEVSIDAAAKNGHLSVVKYLHHMTVARHETKGKKRKREGASVEVGPTCTSAAIDEAAGNNHLEVAKWLHEHRSEGCTWRAMHGAASNGHLEKVKWLTDNRSERYTTETMNLAARNGHLDVVKWLHED